MWQYGQGSEIYYSMQSVFINPKITDVSVSGAPFVDGPFSAGNIKQQYEYPNQKETGYFKKNKLTLFLFM